jgi:hypothetical protein
MRTTTISHCGVSLLVSYEYEPAESMTWDHPGSPECAWLCEAKVAGVDIVDLLSKETIEAIETQILEDAASDAQAARDHYYDMKREDRALERA